MSSRLTKRQTKHLETSGRENNLLEQVKLLQEENSRLQALLAARDSNNDLTPKKSKKNATNTKSRQHRSPSSEENISAITVVSNTPRARNKGCSCKGNCATRACGCVKNNIACAEFCRCGDALCQNQEEDKENIGDPMNQAQLSKEGEESMEKLSQLTIKEDKNAKQEIPSVAARSNKRLENVKKNNHLFSPNNTGVSPNFAEITFDSLSFGDEAVVEVAANNSNEKEKKLKKATRAKNENPKEPQSRHSRLEVQESSGKSRSLSAEEDTSKRSKMENTVTRKRSMSTDGSSKIKRPTKLGQLLGGVKSRRLGRPKTAMVRSEKENDSSNSLDVDKGHVEDVAVKQNKKKPERKQKKTVAIEKQSSKQDPSKADGESSNDNSENNHDKKYKKRSAKNGNKSESTGKQKRKQATVESNDKSNNDNSETNDSVKSKKQPGKKGNKIVPVEKEDDEEERTNRNELHNESDDHNSQNSSTTSETSPEQPDKVIPMESSNSEDQHNYSEVKIKVEETHENSDSCNSEYSPTNAAAIPGNADLLELEANENFDPMKPRRELSRSPRDSVKRSPVMNLQSSCIVKRVLDLSEIPLPVPLPEEPEIEPELPEELKTDIVDWQKHQETLLECGKCGRTFFPLRLKKHESSCHKI